MSVDADNKPHASLAWNDVKDGASRIFNVWFDGTELHWAERAWASMEKAWLTTYVDTVEETRVRVRLLALGSIYWDFCRLGADEEFGWDELHVHATEHLEIQPLRLGQLMGADFEADDLNLEEMELVECALRRLIDKERPAISAAVMKSYGDDWSFLKALFATTKASPTPPDEDDDELPADDEPDFVPAARIMEWIVQGMPSL